MLADIARFARAPVSDMNTRRTVAAVLTSLRRRGTVSVAFVGAARMRTLNHRYHGEDRVTDVLAFPSPPIRAIRGLVHTLGDIIICPVVAKRNAARAGIPWRHECIRLLVHGTLHLLGYDHDAPKRSEQMFTVQERIVEHVKCSMRGSAT